MDGGGRRKGSVNGSGSSTNRGELGQDGRSTWELGQSLRPSFCCALAIANETVAKRSWLMLSMLLLCMNLAAIVGLCFRKREGEGEEGCRFG